MKSKYTILDIPAFKSVPFTLLLLVSLCRKGKTIKHYKWFHTTAKKEFQISSTDSKITKVLKKKEYKSLFEMRPTKETKFLNTKGKLNLTNQIVFWNSLTLRVDQFAECL